jgi:hypothetical protein
VVTLVESRPMAKKKAAHGGTRPGAGRPAKGRDDMAVKVARSIVSKAKAIAQDRGISIAEYLSEKLDGPVSRDFAAMLRANEAKGAE